MDELGEYRNHLIQASQKSQEDYDKTIVALSGGGLAITMAFLDRFLTLGEAKLLILIVTSWVCWGTSLLVTLWSFYASTRALKRAIDQLDAGRIREERPGGKMSVLTGILNVAGGILFVVGVLLVVIFALFNIGSLAAKGG
jgi:hypothetical protein